MPEPASCGRRGRDASDCRKVARVQLLLCGVKPQRFTMCGPLPKRPRKSRIRGKGAMENFPQKVTRRSRVLRRHIRLESREMIIITCLTIESYESFSTFKGLSHFEEIHREIGILERQWTFHWIRLQHIVM
jgi:hypothetical protein